VILPIRGRPVLIELSTGGAAFSTYFSVSGNFKAGTENVLRHFIGDALGDSERNKFRDT
jgi:hypothetical protein